MWNLVPHGILVLLVGMNISNLEDEDAVVVENVIDLPEERLIPADSDMLGESVVSPPEKERRIYSPRPSRD